MEEARKFKRVNIPAEVDVNSLQPLELSCSSTKCEEDFHCFSKKKSSIRKFGKAGVCNKCGADLIDWNRIQKKNIKDVNYLFQSLKKELLRHVMWHTQIEDEAIHKVHRMSADELKIHVRKILKSRIKIKTYRDGWQTPKDGDEITNYAQHATATCCRECLEIWHGIPESEELDEGQLDYFTNLVLLFIEEKLGEQNLKLK